MGPAVHFGRGATPICRAAPYSEGAEMRPWPDGDRAPERDHGASDS